MSTTLTCMSLHTSITHTSTHTQAHRETETERSLTKVSGSCCHNILPSFTIWPEVRHCQVLASVCSHQQFLSLPPFVLLWLKLLVAEKLYPCSDCTGWRVLVWNPGDTKVFQLSGFQIWGHLPVYNGYAGDRSQDYTWTSFHTPPAHNPKATVNVIFVAPVILLWPNPWSQAWDFPFLLRPGARKLPVRERFWF